MIRCILGIVGLILVAGMPEQTSILLIAAGSFVSLAFILKSIPDMV